MELNKYILDNAKQINVCQEYAELIPLAKSAEELLEMYVSPKGIEFCLANNFPSNEDLVRLAGDTLNALGVYVDQSVKLSERPFLVLLGKSHATVKNNGYSVNQLFVKHQSSAWISATDQSFTLIDCFDQSEVHIITEGNARVSVNVYGKAKVVTSGTGAVKIVHKLKEIY